MSGLEGEEKEGVRRDERRRMEKENRGGKGNMSWGVEEGKDSGV